ncbi:MAG: 2-oxo-4-hydroxy-4-carboxy-5-ureidoimidazoline decarboxylase [Rubrobacteraceae bacterium]
MAEERGRRVHPVDEVLPAGKMAAFGLQHVLSMYAGIIAVPLIIATAIGLPPDQLVYIINASFFMCGVATLVQTIGFWKFGVRLPIVQGTTFAAVTPMIAIGGAYGLQGIYGSVIVAGLLTVLAAPFFSKLLRFFPPVVTGTVITIIGISLMPVAIRWAGGGVPDAPDFGSPGNVAMAFVTLLFILAITRFFSGFLGGFLSRIAILLGLVVGTVVAALPIIGLADFSGIGDAAWVGVTLPFAFGPPTFQIVSVVSMSLVMLIVMVETTADILAIGEITEKRVRSDDVARGLRADGLSTAIGGVFNTFPFTAFAQNVGLVRFTNIKSRFVVAAAGVILLVLGFLPKLAALVAAIPLPVLGGAGLVLFGTVAAVGVQTLSKVDFTDNRNIVIVAVSLAFGIIPAALPEFYEGFPEGAQIFLDSGITAAAVSAILLNIFFHILGGERVGTELGEPASRLTEEITVMQANDLSDEEFARKFAPLFQGVSWVPERALRERPFTSLYELRHAFQDAVFDAPPEQQRELIRAYPDLAGEATEAGTLSPLSMRDQAAAGLDRLSDEEYGEFRRLNEAYREKFEMPMIFCVREHSPESIFASGKARLENSPAQESAAALVEIAKIANLRLRDLADEPMVTGRN